MAIYFTKISNISRDTGRSSVATAAYIEAKKMKDIRIGKTYNYRRKERVITTGVMLPNGAPERYKDSEVLLNEIELYEKAENARTAKLIIAALPREFDYETNKRVVEEYIRINLTSKGYCTVYAIHCDKDGNNPHVHILVVNRALDSNGKWMTKCRKEYALDENGNRIPVIDPETGKQKLGLRNSKQWKRVNVEVNPLDQKETLNRLRSSWAEECNKHLDSSNWIDHRSYEERGIDRIPQIKEGYAARQIEERGGISEICQKNREIKNANQQMEEVTRQEKEIQEQIDQNKKEVEELYGILRRAQTGNTKDVIRKAERGIKREKAYDSFIKKVLAKARTILDDIRTIIRAAGSKAADREAARGERETERGGREAARGERETEQGKREIARGERETARREREIARGTADSTADDCCFARLARGAEQRKRETARGEREAAQGEQRIGIEEARAEVRNTRAALAHRRDERKAGIGVIQHVSENLEKSENLNVVEKRMESLNVETKMEERDPEILEILEEVHLAEEVMRSAKNVSDPSWREENKRRSENGILWNGNCVEVLWRPDETYRSVWYPIQEFTKIYQELCEKSGVSIAPDLVNFVKQQLHEDVPTANDITEKKEVQTIESERNIRPRPQQKRGRGR